MAGMQNVVIPTTPQNFRAPAIWQDAISAAAHIGQGVAGPDYALLTHDKGQLGPSSFLSHNGLLGPAAAKTLLNGNPVNVPGLGSLTHRTKAMLRATIPGNCILIVYFANDALLEKLDEYPGVAGIVVVPQLMSDIQEWDTIWTPTWHGHGVRTQQNLLHPMAVATMKTLLVGSQNRIDATVHPSDKQRIKEVVKEMKPAGICPARKGARLWFRRQGFHPKWAAEASRLFP